MEGSSDQYTESGLSVNSEETYINEELDDNSHQNTNDRNHKSKKYKLLKFISKHTLNILYGILGSIVASALTGAIYSIVNITGNGIEMTNNTTNNNLTNINFTTNSGTSSVRPKPLFWFRSNTEAESQNGRYFWAKTVTSRTPRFKGRNLVVDGVTFFPS